jgi:hypothetical protein
MNVSEANQPKSPTNADTAMALSDLVDPSDFCRGCRGTGGANEATGRGTKLFQDCFLCGGTGQRTIRISSPHQPIAAE